MIKEGVLIGDRSEMCIRDRRMSIRGEIIS